MPNSQPNKGAGIPHFKGPNNLLIKAREFLARAKEKEPKTTGELSGRVGATLQNKSKETQEKERTILNQAEIRQELETTLADLLYGDAVDAKIMTESEAMLITQKYYDSDQSEIDALRIFNSAKTRAEQINLINQQKNLWKNFYLTNKN